MSAGSLTACVVLLAVAGGLAGCGPGAERSVTPPLPAVEVRAQAALSKPRAATEEVVGTVRARLHSVIEAKVTGRIEKLPVVPGQSIRTGDLLAELGARELQARAEQAHAVRQQAEADLKRFTTLWEQKILSQAEFDNAQSRFRVADAAATEADTLLSYIRVVAPFDGVVTRKLADVGDLATPGRPLLEMEDARALRLEADVPEAVIGRIKLGDPLPVQIAALETNLEGTISEIAPAADANSRTFLVKLDLPSANGLRAGQFGRVAVPVGETTTLRVPAAAMVQRGQMEMVFVIAGGHAHLRLVKTGKRVDDEIELVSGIDPGEQIVIDHAATLLDGQPVTLRP